MTKTFQPENEDQTGEAVAQALADKTALELLGSGSKKPIGNLMTTDGVLDLSHLTGITLYEPEELVLSAGAGSDFLEITNTLAEKGQNFAFEPPDFSGLLGTNTSGALTGTLGGMVASGFAGPRRVLAGGVRDHVLGVRAVSGRAEVFKTGGRVVKNVTGYDLPKILTGSWGTLAAMTQITFKVLPKPETEATLAISGLDNFRAMKAMSAALSAPVEVSAAAHVPGDQTFLRLEGIAPSVLARLQHLKKVLAPFGDTKTLERELSQNIWQDMRDVKRLGNDRSNPVWRLSVPPFVGAKVLEKIEKSIKVNAFFDWGGGLIWLEVVDQTSACAAEIRSAVAASGGHATLIRAVKKTRAGSSVFQPQSAALTMLSERLKNAFDPQGILNPGRMHGCMKGGNE